MKIAVHGSTGAQGAPVAAALAERGHDVKALTRTASTADAAQVSADLEDQASLEAAYAGADGVFVHLPIPLDASAPARWAAAIVGALANSDVKRVVFSTSGASLAASGADPMLQARFEGAKAFYAGLQSVADHVVALAPRLFLENLLLPFVSGPALTDGVLRYPLSADKPISWTSHFDVAQAVAIAFHDATPAGIYDIGHAPLLGEELAAELGSALGQPMRYEAISPSAFTEAASPLFGAEMAASVGALYAAFATDDTLMISADAAQLGVEKRLTLAQWAKRCLKGG